MVEAKKEVTHLADHREEGGGEGGRRDLGAVEKRGRSKDTMLRRIVRSCDIQDDLLSSFLVARDANCLQRERERGGVREEQGGRGGERE